MQISRPIKGYAMEPYYALRLVGCAGSPRRVAAAQKGWVYAALWQVMVGVGRVGRLNPSFDGRSVELAGSSNHSPLSPMNEKSMQPNTRD